LEEQGDARAELLRLLHVLTQELHPPERPTLEARLRELLAEGVEPVGPYWTNSLGMRFACIPPGTYLMGSPETEEMRMKNETQHAVTLTNGLWMGVHPVTQEQWQAVMGNYPSQFQHARNLPVETVSWEDCQEFLKRLGEQDKKLYRLPTEAEWEYACRAGTSTPFFFGPTLSTDKANYDGSCTYGSGKEGVYRQKTTPVGTFPQNAWGLHDMDGNVREWCQDWFGDYTTSEVVNPQGPNVGQYRVLRGGSWFDSPESCRSASRPAFAPGNRDLNVGMRVCFYLTNLHFKLCPLAAYVYFQPPAIMMVTS
jgi:formylglycine-generating enzyme required for sulfatase activity